MDLAEQGAKGSLYVLQENKELKNYVQELKSRMDLNERKHRAVTQEMMKELKEFRDLAKEFP